MLIPAKLEQKTAVARRHVAAQLLLQSMAQGGTPAVLPYQGSQGWQTKSWQGKGEHAAARMCLPRLMGDKLMKSNQID